MRKVIIIMLAMLVAFSTLSVSYAYWTGCWGKWCPNQAITYCNPQCDVAFTSVSTDDNEEQKDVAQTSASIKDDAKRIVVTIDNAYPGYEGYVNFTIENTGDLPIEITDIVTTNSNTDYLELEIAGEWETDPVIQSGDTRSGRLVQGITQLAAQNATYSFSITIQAEQYGDLSSPFGAFAFGGEPIYYIETNIFGIMDRYRISYEGVLLETIEVTSADDMFTIIIPEGSVLLDKDGKRLKILEVEFDQSPPPSTVGAYIIGSAYYLSPDGATFDPPFELLINYDLEELRENTSSVFIAYYDAEQGWIQLERISGFIAAVGTATAQVSHFTTFAIIGTIMPPPPLSPAAFKLSSLSISPVEVIAGETVTISLLVTNIGGMSGSHTVTFKINGVNEANKTVTLATGGSQTVTFSVTRNEAGNYSVDVDGLSGSFTVKPPEEEEVAQTPEEEEVITTAVKPFNWLPVGIVIIVLIIGLGVLFWFRRRRRRTSTA